MPPTPRLLIVRFGPWSAEKCRATATDQFEDDLAEGRDGRYGISVFGAEVAAGESVDDALLRICKEAPCNGKKVATLWADELPDWTAQVDQPPPHHYLLGEGDLSALPDVDSLALMWSENKRNNPAFGREVEGHGQNSPGSR